MGKNARRPSLTVTILGVLAIAVSALLYFYYIFAPMKQLLNGEQSIPIPMKKTAPPLVPAQPTPNPVRHEDPPVIYDI